jgi:hypothetical protein
MKVFPEKLSALFALFVLFIASSLCIIIFDACSPRDPSESLDCPLFQSYQVYPLMGEYDTSFMLVVIMVDNDENQSIQRIRAEVHNYDGSFTGMTMDLIPSPYEADWNRYYRSFKGSEICNQTECNYYLRVIALHKSGCSISFNTQQFQITGEPVDDDSSVDDDTSDDDTTDDDTSDDDVIDDDTSDDDTTDDDSGTTDDDSAAF